MTLYPFVSSEAEKRPTRSWRFSTQFILSDAAGGVEGLEANGGGINKHV